MSRRQRFAGWKSVRGERRPMKIMKPVEWEAEAVDFLAHPPFEEFSRQELLKYSREAQDFILRTMNRMELRPKRSFIRKLGCRL